MTASFWTILVVVLVYGLLHSFLASLHLKARVRRWFGPRSDRWFRLLYNFLASLTLLPILFLPVLLVDQELYRIPFPWYLLTGMLQILSLFVLLLGLKQTGIRTFLGLRSLPAPSASPPAALVTGGLYRTVRHPLYSAGLVFIWLFPVMTCNLLAINLGLTLYIFIGAYFEERKLLCEYGAVYAEYKKETPMLIPGLKRKRD